MFAIAMTLVNNSLRVCAVVVCMLSFFFTAKAQSWTLDSCISFAFQNNLAIQLSEENVALTSLNETNAIGSMLPSLNAQGGHGYNWGQRIDPFTNQFASSRIQSNNFAIATSMNLFNGLRQVNTLKQAGLNTETAKWNYEKMRNDIALNVASAYLAVIINKEFMEIARRTLDGTDRQVKRMEKLVSAGQLAVSNLNDMQAQLASDNATFVSSENNFKLSKLSLIQLLQLDARQLEQFTIVKPTLDEVERWAAHMAYCQFTEVEMRNGTAWRILQGG